MAGVSSVSRRGLDFNTVRDVLLDLGFCGDEVFKILNIVRELEKPTWCSYWHMLAVAALIYSRRNGKALSLEKIKKVFGEHGLTLYDSTLNRIMKLNRGVLTTSTIEVDVKRVAEDVLNKLVKLGVITDGEMETLKGEVMRILDGKSRINEIVDMGRIRLAIQKASVAVYLASLLKGIKIDQPTICRITGISEVTFRSNLRRALKVSTDKKIPELIESIRRDSHVNSDTQGC